MAKENKKQKNKWFSIKPLLKTKNCIFIIGGRCPGKTYALKQLENKQQNRK